MALAETLRAARKQHPDRPALRFEGQSWTYAELVDIIDRLAASLVRLGIQPGDRVALHFTNCPELVFGYYACFKIGAVAVPLNTRCKGPELEYMLNHTGARMFLGEAALFSELHAARPRLAAVEQYYLTGDASAFPAVRPFEELLAPAPAEVPFPIIAADAPAVITYTSGTTARPKGVLHSHATLGWAVENRGRPANAADHRATGAVREEPAVWGVFTPMCHAAGMAVALVALGRGATLLVIPRFEPELVLESLSAHQVTATFGLPVMWLALANHPGASIAHFRSLKLCVASGDTVPVALQRSFQERFGLALTEAYGSTEARIVIINPNDETRKVGSLGLPTPGVCLRLLDEQGREVPPGETGELVVKHPGVMVGYWQDPEATAAALRDGWLSTGDLARCDADGYYWFAGRKKEIIIRGGSNISPQEVEAVLYQHPAVREAGVVGAPDETWGEVVHAFVALKDGAAASEAELRQFVAGRIAAYKVTEAIHFVAELPQGATGKLQRKTLREWASGKESEEQ